MARKRNDSQSAGVRGVVQPCAAYLVGASEAITPSVELLRVSNRGGKVRSETLTRTGPLDRVVCTKRDFATSCPHDRPTSGQDVLMLPEGDWS